MRKIFPVLASSAFLLTTPSVAQETRYSISDLHRLLHERGDIVYVSTNGWLYSAELHPKEYPSQNMMFIVGFKNRGRYPKLENAPVDYAGIKRILEGDTDEDLLAACTGPALGDADSGYEYFFRSGEVPLVGTDISPEYRQAYARIINDIATAIVKSKK